MTISIVAGPGTAIPATAKTWGVASISVSHQVDFHREIAVWPIVTVHLVGAMMDIATTGNQTSHRVPQAANVRAAAAEWISAGPLAGFRMGIRWFCDGTVTLLTSVCGSAMTFGIALPGCVAINRKSHTVLELLSHTITLVGSIIS